MKKIICMAVAVFLIGGGLAVGQGEEGVKPSPRFIIIYGSGNLEVGDLIRVYDPDGVLCGSWKVVDSGYYGQMMVYGDDPMTPEIDEGAKRDEVLTIKVNDREVVPVDGPVIWELNDEPVRVDL